MSTECLQERSVSTSRSSDLEDNDCIGFCVYGGYTYDYDPYRKVITTYRKGRIVSLNSPIHGEKSHSSMPQMIKSELGSDCTSRDDMNLAVNFVKWVDSQGTNIEGLGSFLEGAIYGFLLDFDHLTEENRVERMQRLIERYGFPITSQDHLRSML